MPKRNLNNNRVNNSVSNSAKQNTQPKAKPEVKELTLESLTPEQRNQGLALRYIIEHVTDKDGNKVLQLIKDKANDVVKVAAVDGLNASDAKRATGRVLKSAKVDLGGKYDSKSHSYTWSYAQFVEFNKYYKLVKDIDINAEETPKEKEQPKTKPVSKEQHKNDMITKAEAMARCKKMLSEYFKKDFLDALEDDLKEAFA